MCHQHVEPGRAERANERNPATFEGPCCSAHVLPCAAGDPRRSPGPGAGLERPRILGQERAELREHGARGPGCGRRAGRSGLGPEAPRFGPASPGWAQVTGRCAPGPRGHGVRALGSFSACSRRARVDTGPGAHISRVPSTVFRPACTARRVTLRGLVLEPIGRGRAGQMASLRNGPRASAVPKTSGGTQPWTVHQGRTAPRTPRRTGTESWVFAGKMRVSVQLAYKVPVLGPQDRHFLHVPRRLRPAPSWPSCAPAGPPTRMSTRVEGLGRRAPRVVCAVRGNLCFGRVRATHLKV